MISPGIGVSQEQFLDGVKDRIRADFDGVTSFLESADDQRRLTALAALFKPGKMLRTRLAVALCPNDDHLRVRVIDACAATELIHTATLFHDDVIDGASMRRKQPTLWRHVGQTGAILMGDLFFSSALQLVLRGGDLRMTTSFVDKVREVCATEMAHEVFYRDQHANVALGVRIARGKTGPLFAFVAEACGGEDIARSNALAEAGYLVGTAYQLADDLLDEIGDEDSAGKTLGTDRERRKFTLAQGSEGKDVVERELRNLCEKASDQLKPWPELSKQLNQFLSDQFLPLEFD
jgi:geranylgeranyl pyrophosphate synthase